MNKLETVVLDNGLTLYLYNDLRRHSTFFQFTTKCGGMTKDFICDGCDYHLHDGVAHILEHYIVECNEMGNFLDELGNMQMSTNASTSLTTTSYYFETVENIDKGIKLLLEGINNITFDKEKLEKLKNPIYQEVRGKFDNKFYHANRRRINNIFKYGSFSDIGGTLEEVKKTTIDDLKALYTAFYQPSNQFITIAGNFDRNQVIKEINDYYKINTFSKHEVEIISFPETVEVNKKEDILIFPTPMEYYEICFKIDISKYNCFELLDLDFYLNSFYSNCFGVTSVLYKKLVDEEIIIDNINYSDTIMNSFLLITVGAYTNDYKKFRDYVLNEVNNYSLDKNKFELDKKNSIMYLILRDESIMKMIFPFINNVIYYNYPYLDTVHDVEKLTYDSYCKMMGDIDFSNYSTLLIKEKE